MGEPVKQHDASELAAGYTTQHRTYEICGIVVALASSAWLIARIVKCPPLSGWWMPLAALVGILLSDFISGFVHWLFDSWGNLDTPVFGRLAIRTFRHHHVDQKAITTHDFIETNGHNISLTTIYSVSGLLTLRSVETATLFDVFVCQSLVCATFFTAFTSQIHKWAHQDKPSRLVALLQRARLILSPEHHAAHHSAPYNRNYCITVGWMNGPLRAVRFFETLERTITAITGVVPREDDLGAVAAFEVASENGALDDADDKKALATRD
ncbi:MAG: fatty acid desaturase family protein [Labilithrix sp.]|nr:fatty acid desaturase family protein [Labilithrix sp.]